jgi:hypothetical protein
MRHFFIKLTQHLTADEMALFYVLKIFFEEIKEKDVKNFIHASGRCSVER